MEAVEREGHHGVSRGKLEIFKLLPAPGRAGVEACPGVEESPFPFVPVIPPHDAGEPRGQPQVALPSADLVAVDEGDGGGRLVAQKAVHLRLSCRAEVAETFARPVRPLDESFQGKQGEALEVLPSQSPVGPQKGGDHEGIEVRVFAPVEGWRLPPLPGPEEPLFGFFQEGFSAGGRKGEG